LPAADRTRSAWRTKVVGAFLVSPRSWSDRGPDHPGGMVQSPPPRRTV